MNNQRFEILLDELRERCEKILEYEVSDDELLKLSGKNEEFLHLVTHYVFYIFTTQEFQSRFIELIQWYDNRLKSSEVRELLDNVSCSLQTIGKLIQEYPERERILLSKQFNQSDNWSNPFDKDLRELTGRQLISKLNERHDFSADTVNRIQLVINLLKSVDGVNKRLLDFFIDDDSLDKKLSLPFEELQKCFVRLKIHLEFERKHSGHDEAVLLYNEYKNKFPQLRMDSEKWSYPDLGFGEISSLKAKRLKEASKRILKILSRYIASNKNKTYTISRLKSYIEWFYNSNNINNQSWHENDLTNEMARFLFAQGFFPFIRFNTGSSEPDMFVLSPHEEILIEAKKYFKKDKINSKKINHHITQAIQYYDKVKSFKHNVENQVFLIIFYDGDYYPVCAESIFKNGVFVKIVFIYLGTKTPHEKREDLVIDVDNSI